MMRAKFLGVLDCTVAYRSAERAAAYRGLQGGDSLGKLRDRRSAQVRGIKKRSA
jgi:hypothetical protein